jgi:hypothetical protein
MGASPILGVPASADPQEKTAPVNSPFLNGFHKNGNQVWSSFYERLRSRNAFAPTSIGVDSGFSTASLDILPVGRERTQMDPAFQFIRFFLNVITLQSN